MSAMAAAMTTGFSHAPVLLARVVEQMQQIASPRLIVDATVGGGGHAAALLETFPGADLLGVDRDPDALAASRSRLAPFGERVQLAHGPFSELPDLLADRGISHVDGLVADLGVSSFQLDEPDRGFSFRAAGPLDMRMDPTSGESAAELLREIPEADLSRAIKRLGEERFARRVARAIKAANPENTETLAEVVRAAIPKRGPQRIDPATRTFQAIRMLINDEVGELGALLEALPALLADGGVAVVISFHSIEDRAVKRALRSAAKGCICPPDAPACACGRLPTLALLTKRPLVATEQELSENPRSRSAKLRAAQRLARAT